MEAFPSMYRQCYKRPPTNRDKRVTHTIGRDVELLPNAGEARVEHPYLLLIVALALSFFFLSDNFSNFLRFYLHTKIFHDKTYERCVRWKSYNMAIRRDHSLSMYHFITIKLLLLSMIFLFYFDSFNSNNSLYMRL